MAHESLYRKYRPQSFKEVAGQEQVIRPLAQEIKDKKIGHAYLFSGSRGLGKTSVARIFAREIGASEQDIAEIDAASNNSVEDIRSLADNVYTLPFGSPYKVYILDEAHMLSKAAWNAFLKTLEEPPAHAVFILATTEPERIPETVVSRCQVFEFKKPSRNDLAKVIAEVAKKEGFTLALDAADLVSLLAGGSYRDALSTLQKVLAAAPDKKVSREDAEGATGAPKRELVDALISALALGDRAKALGAIEKAVNADTDIQLFLELVIESLRRVLLIRHAPEIRASLAESLGVEEFATLEKFAKEKGITHHTLLAFLTASERIRYAPIAALPLELAVLELFPE